MYNVDKFKYGKPGRTDGKDMLQRKKDPFPKTIAKTCRVLADGKINMEAEIIVYMMPMMGLPL